MSLELSDVAFIEPNTRDEDAERDAELMYGFTASGRGTVYEDERFHVNEDTVPVSLEDFELLVRNPIQSMYSDLFPKSDLKNGSE